MIKNIIFDWSGVINDSTENNRLIANEILKKFGSREISLQEFRETWEQPYINFYHKYLPNITLVEVRTSYMEVCFRYLKGKPYSGIVDILKNFKTHGIQMVILSSDLPEVLLSEIKDFDLENIFIDYIADAHDKAQGLRELIERKQFL